MRTGKQFLWRAGLAAICLALLFNVFPARLVLAQEGSPPPVLRFEQISLREGLSQSSVYAILQDHYGFLWFGTEGGLNKYDGYQFAVYKHDPDNPSTLANNIISALSEDHLGTLWVGTGEGLDRFNRESGTFTHYKKDPQDAGALSGTLVWAILEDSSGTLWVGTNDGGLNRFDRDTNSFTHFRHDSSDPDSIGGDSVKAIYEDQQGMLWVGTDAGLERFDRERGTFAHFPRPVVDAGNPNSSLVLTIYEDSQGALWVGSNGDGLGKFDRSTQTWTDYSNNPDNPDSLSSDVVWAVLEDLKGRLWIGTDGGGLDLLDPQQEHFHHYRHDPSKLDSLSRDSIRALFEDRSGVFWVGTYGGGLSKSTHNVNKFALYRQEPGLGDSLSDNYIWSISGDASGALWLGTFQGGLNRLDLDGGTVKVYRHDPKDPASLSSDDVRSVLVDSQGTVWAGTGAQGLNRLDLQSGKFVQFHHDPNDPNSLISDQIRVLFEDRSGNLWVGTYANGLDLFDRQSGVFTHFKSDPADPHSLISDRVRSLYQDREGYLWIGTSGGISRLNPGTNEFARYSSDAQNPNSLSNPTVFSFYEDGDGILWIATFGGGLNRFDPISQTFTHYTEADGLPHNQVYNILVDAAANLWLSTNNGISRFNPKAGTFRNYGIQDGLQNIEFNLGSAYQGKDGQMFFGGIDGLNAFYPEQVQDSAFTPPIVITAFQKFNQTALADLSPDESLQLSYKDNFFSFEFAALDFTAPEKNQYAYMLEGFDKDWIEAGTRRYASYTNLGGGNYTFRVKGTNSDGVWNEAGISIPISITPPYWQTWWFTLLAVAVLAGGTAGVYAMRGRSFKIQKEHLEFEVAQRTEEIEQRRKVAESLRDILTVLNSNRPLDEILGLIADQTARLLACDGIAIYRFRPEEGVLTIQTASGLGPDYVTGLAVPLGKGVTGIAAQTRQPVTVNDSHGSWLDQTPAEVAPDQRRLLESIRERYRAILSVPLIVQRELYGALTLYYQAPREFLQEEIDLGVTVAEQAALALETARLRDQAGELAASAERSRLARELHDAVTQTLFASNLVAEALPIIWERNPEEGQQRLRELGQLNRGALAEMRSLLLELRPAALLEAEMADLFRYLTDAFTGRTHVPVSLQVETDGKASRDLPAEVKVGLYRIAQETLNNIAKHAQASKVVMEVRCQVGRIVMRIRDNGLGFDTQGIQAGHFGLGIMQERAQGIGAAVEVSSEIGKGTEVCVSWVAGDREPEGDGSVTSPKQ